MRVPPFAMAGLFVAFGMFQPPVARAQLVWAFSHSSVDEIQRANTNGTNYSAVLSPLPGTSPWAMALDAPGGRVFWSDIISPNYGVYTAGLNGANPQLIYNAPAAVFGAAYHANSNQLFVATRSQIMRMNSDGSNAAAIVTGLSNADSLAIDHATGKIYWTEQAANRIARANLDGTSVETVVNTTYAGSTTERGIALDGQGGLYWLDAATDGLYKANLASFSGTPLTATQILNLQGVIGGNSSPNGLASDGASLYWSDGASGHRGIYRTDFDGLNAGQLVSTQPTNGSPMGLAVAAVPEPTSLALTALAAIGVWRFRRGDPRATA